MTPAQKRQVLMKLFQMAIISIFVIFSFQLDQIIADYLVFIREGLTYTSHRKLKMKNEITILGTGPIGWVRLRMQLINLLRLRFR